MQEFFDYCIPKIILLYNRCIHEGDEIMGYELDTTLKIDRVFSILYYDLSYNYKFQGEKHDFWEILIVDQGAVKVRRNDDFFIARAGEIIIHEPGEFHGIFTEKNQNAHIFILTFSTKSHLIKTLSRANLRRSNEMDYYISEIYKHAEACFLACHPGGNEPVFTTKKPEDIPIGTEQLLQMNMEAFIISLIRQQIANTEKEERKRLHYPTFIEEVNEILLEALHEKNLLAKLEQELCLSKRTIQYRIKEEVGMTLSQYIRQLRIEKGKELLRRRELTVTEIADKLGYSTVHYFSSQFRTYNEMSPTEYRNALKLKGHPLTYSKKK